MNENKIKVDGKEYIAVEQKPMIICGDCCFYTKEPVDYMGRYCSLNHEVSCVGDDRKDGRNIIWKEKEKKKCQK